MEAKRPCFKQEEEQDRSNAPNGSTAGLDATANGSTHHSGSNAPNGSTASLDATANGSTHHSNADHSNSRRGSVAKKASGSQRSLGVDSRSNLGGISEREGRSSRRSISSGGGSRRKHQVLSYFPRHNCPPLQKRRFFPCLAFFRNSKHTE